MKPLSRPSLPVVLAFALVTGALLPAHAQPTTPAAHYVDPFEAIVSDREGANTRLNDVSIPVRNPSEHELRQYLEAFRVINLSAAFVVDDGRPVGPTHVRIPAGEARLGPFKVPGGTEIRLEAGFVKRPGEDEAVLRTLEMVPANPMALGPLRFNRMTLDDKGVLHFKLNLKLMGFNFWPQEMTVEKIYRDRDGNLVFQTGGTGLAGKFVPDIRVKPDGVVQRYKRGFLGIGRGWSDLKDKGVPVTMPASLPITRWPPRATDLIDWMPAPGATGTHAAPDVDALRPLLESIPIRDMAVAFRAVADPRRIVLSGDRGHLDLSDHRLEFDAHGRFDGRTFVSDDARPNSYLATGRLSGEVRDPALGSARLDGLALDFSGTHRTRLPFEDPADTDFELTMAGTVHGRLSRVEGGLPGGPNLSAPRADVRFDGAAKLALKPLEEGTESSSLRIDPESRYAMTIDGPVELSGLRGAAPTGVVLPDRIVLDAPASAGGPVLEAEGTLGTRLGMVFARTDVKIDGETRHPGIVGLLEGEEEVASATLRPGARVSVDLYAFAGMREGDLLGGVAGGGVRVTNDTRVSGTIEDTTVRHGGVTVELPGAADLEARAASNVRFGTENGAETIVRAAAAEVSATLREGEGRFEAGLPGAPTLNARIAPGTRLEASTGMLRRVDVHGTMLETEGYARGERGARMRANLILVAGSVAHEDLAVAFGGGASIDLSAALGFRFDPAAFMAGQPEAAPSGPVAVDLALALDFVPGSTLTFLQGGDQSQLRLGGATRFVAHARLEVDPLTGTPTLQGLHGIDLVIEAESIDVATLLPGLTGVTVAQIGSRTTARLKNASVEVLERGLRVRHEGITFEVAPGTIEIGTR